MMRWLALGLLLANVLFALGMLQRGPEPGSVIAAPSPAGEPLVLIKERPERRPEAAPPIDTVVAAPETAPAPAMPTGSPEAAPGLLPLAPAIPLCEMLGPVTDVDVARQLRDRLIVGGLDAAAYRMAVPVRTDYWVHLGPLATRRDALDLLRELQQQQIDSFIITEGELANSISLGYFTREASARRAMEERREQGYDAKVSGISRYDDQYWVAIEEPPESVDEQLIPDGVERRKNFCDVIASAEKLE